LEIFDRHAKTPQAKLQIEQARLSYDLPFERHQIRMRLQKEHTGDRPVAEQIGAGEDLLNLRIRDIRRRLALIRDKLETISDTQELKKKRRAHLGFLEIAIAGYTNAGKSTLHQSLTGSEVEIADELFTTLATKAASLDIPGRQVVISDSVGFISDLPRALLQAFNTTLMEIADADVIVLVVDASDATEEMLRKVHASLDTFTKVGVNGIPIITALNKMDLLQEDDLSLQIEALKELCNSIIPISAQNETNLDKLLEAINEELPNLYRYSVSIPYGDSGMSIISWLHEVASVENQEYVEGQMKVDVLLSLETLDRLRTKLPDAALTLLSVQSREDTS
jgi:GTP-binding protein HflX